MNTDLPPLRIIIADDHALVRGGIAMLFVLPTAYYVSLLMGMWNL